MFLIISTGQSETRATTAPASTSAPSGDLSKTEFARGSQGATLMDKIRARGRAAEEKAKSVGKATEEKTKSLERQLTKRIENSWLAKKLGISSERASKIAGSITEALTDDSIVGSVVNFVKNSAEAINLGKTNALKKLLIAQLSDLNGLEEFVFKRVLSSLKSDEDKNLLIDYRERYKKTRTIEEVRSLDEKIAKDDEFENMRGLLRKVDSIALLRKLAGSLSPANLTVEDKDELSQELAELTLLGIKDQKNAPMSSSVTKLKGIYLNLIENCDKPEYKQAALQLSEELSKLLTTNFMIEYLELFGKMLIDLAPQKSIIKCVYSLLPESVQSACESKFGFYKDRIITKLTFADNAEIKQEVITFRKLYSKTLSEADRNNINRILAIDPFFNGGAPGTTPEGKVSVATRPQALDLLNIYSEGGDFQYKDSEGKMQNAALAPLSPKARKALTALATWYLGYRENFPDPTETQPLRNIFSLITGTMDGHLKWDICTILSEKGDILSAFSGQAIKAGGLAMAWGEHIYCSKEARGHGYGAKALEKFNQAASELCGKTDGFMLEMDNPFAMIRDFDNVENFAYFNHSDRAAQRAAWTDPNGMNMAMNPFERMKVWHKLGFKLVAVQRSDLEKLGLTAMPYTQIPLDSSIGKPCEILVIAIKPGKQLESDINSGKVTAKNIFEVYREMMRSISPTFESEPSYQATAKELSLLTDDHRISLIDICDESGKHFNPDAIELLKRSAVHKLR